MCLVLLLMQQSLAVEPLPSFAQPAASPDGREIAFVSGGSIWTVSGDGGEAHLLVTQAADAARPIYSPDGKRLAFISNRTGNGDIYVVSLDDGAMRRVTFDDAADRLDAWSTDGKWLYFTTSGHNYGGSDLYRVNPDGGTPMPVVSEMFQGCFAGTPSPDGRTIAFCGGSMAASQWWRHGHSHIDETQIWISGTDHAAGLCTQLTAYGSKDLWPLWSADGRTIYFMSDRDGNENIWAMDVPATPVTATKPAAHPGAVSTTAASSTTRPTVAPMPMPRQLTHFHDGRVLWPGLSADGKTLVFERDFGIWKLNLTSGAAAPMPIRLRGVVAGPAVDHQALSRNVSELAVSHDGKKLAVVVRGQIFAAPAAGGNTGNGSAVRVTHTEALESHPSWANDDHRLVYVSTRDSARHVFLYDFNSRKESQLTRSVGNDSRPLFSPDDVSVAFQRDGRELRAVRVGFAPTTQSTADRLIAGNLSFERPPFDGDGTPFMWAPAGDWLVCVSGGAKGFRNLYMIPSAGGTPTQVSFLANAQSNSVAWSPDGRALFFGSGQRTEDFQLARVDLSPRTPKFREDQFSDLFRERPNRPGNPPERTPRQPSGESSESSDAEVAPSNNVPSTNALPTTRPATRPTTRPLISFFFPRSNVPATKPTEVVFEDIDQRLSLVPVGVDVDQLTVSPDGKWLAFVGTSAGRSNIYVYPLDPLAENPSARQLTVNGGFKEFVQFAPDPMTGMSGLRVYWVEGGIVHYVFVNGGTGGNVTDCPVTVEFDQDFERDKVAVFDQAWRYLDENFHDPAMHGVDWKATRQRFAPHVAGARTPYELRRLLSLMIGELNASHMGVTGPSEDNRGATARLGVTFDPGFYERRGLLRVASVIPFGPAELSKLSVGDYVLAIDGTSTASPVNLDQILDRKVDKEIVLSISKREDNSDKHDVRLLTVSAATERTLLYRAWVRANQIYVRNASHGRLGYVHIADMGQAALTRLYTDLDARNENYDGVVVDVRNNNGGFVNGYAIDVFARRNYLTIEQRGFPKISGRAALGQRYLGQPTILVTNRETLSDGEDFTEGYQALHMGDTVGESTAGWIIFTRGCGLLDGSGLRLPSETVYAADGSPMEMHPRPVTYQVLRPIGESAAQRDSQLDEAVRQLIRKIDEKR